MIKAEDKTILLVEDDSATAILHRRFLENNSFNVITVSNGEGAVKAVDKDTTVDLILMDIHLGEGMDGTEAAEKHMYPLNKILRKTVNLLPSAMQFPDITCARIIHSNDVYLSDNFCETGYKISSELKIDNIKITDNTIATHIFYIIQESLNNAFKHGRANNIEISVKKKTDKLEIIIEDDGTGFLKTLPVERGLGLEFMKHRVNIIGGKIDFSFIPDRGATVFCLLDSTPWCE